MISGEAILAAFIVVGLWVAGTETVKGVQKMNHAIAAKFHRNRKPVPPPAAPEDK